MGTLNLLLVTLPAHAMQALLFGWLVACAAALAAAVVCAVQVRRHATAGSAPARSKRSKRKAHVPPVPVAAAAPVGRHEPAPGRWSASLVDRLGEDTQACSVTADELAAGVQWAAAGYWGER